MTNSPNKAKFVRAGRDPMRLGMQRFRSAQFYASAASLFVELPWVPLKLLFRALLKELEIPAKK